MADPDTIHVYPIDDLIEHEIEGDDCPCLPQVEAVEREDGSYGWIVLHSAWDGRE